MKKNDYITIPQLANMLGISRIAVYNKVRKGQIKAVKIGRIFAIPQSQIGEIMGRKLSKKDKKEIDLAVEKTVREYGSVLKLLGS
jgi:excisionase family DNA binding protein